MLSFKQAAVSDNRNGLGRRLTTVIALLRAGGAIHRQIPPEGAARAVSPVLAHIKQAHAHAAAALPARHRQVGAAAGSVVTGHASALALKKTAGWTQSHPHTDYCARSKGAYLSGYAKSTHATQAGVSLLRRSRRRGQTTQSRRQEW
jgi:hypothetical protein